MYIQASMHQDIKLYNEAQTGNDTGICQLLSELIGQRLPQAESKLWHGHPVWFLEGNPIAGYSKQKAGIRLMFWSGASFDEEALKPGTGKFKDASIFYNATEEINPKDLERWLDKAERIQWNYKDLVKQKGVLERLK